MKEEDLVMVTNRVVNFSAGPSMLPEAVLQTAATEMLNYQNTGMSVMEMSHRSSAYLTIFENTKNLLKKVMDIPSDYEVLLLHGGATFQFSMIPMNFIKEGSANYIVTGAFSKKAMQEATKYGKVHVSYDGKGDNYKRIPRNDELDITEDASYVHYCANNTIYGTEWDYIPETNGVPLICDMSSNILSKPVDVSKYDMIYAGAQKNMGIAGLGVVIVKKSFIKDNVKDIPVLMEYKTMLENDSMYNTPPAYAIYMLGLVLEWIDNDGGLDAMNKRNIDKAALLYDYLEASDFYTLHSDTENRSNMNVTFTTPSKELDDLFVKESQQVAMTNLKGHRSVGGIRASIYNAMPVAGVEKLVAFSKAFEQKNK